MSNYALKTILAGCCFRGQLIKSKCNKFLTSTILVWSNYMNSVDDIKVENHQL